MERGRCRLFSTNREHCKSLHNASRNNSLDICIVLGKHNDMACVNTWRFLYRWGCIAYALWWVWQAITPIYKPTAHSGAGCLSCWSQFWSRPRMTSLPGPNSMLQPSSALFKQLEPFKRANLRRYTYHTLLWRTALCSLRWMKTKPC